MAGNGGPTRSHARIGRSARIEVLSGVAACCFGGKLQEFCGVARSIWTRDDSSDVERYFGYKPPDLSSVNQVSSPSVMGGDTEVVIQAPECSPDVTFLTAQR